MRIAVVTTSYPEGDDDPSGHFVRAEVRGLTREGHTVHVLSGGGRLFKFPGVLANLRTEPLRAIDGVRFFVSSRRALERLGAIDRVVAHWAVPCAWPITTPLFKGRFRASGTELEVVSHGADVRMLLAMPAAARVAIVSSIAARASVWRFVAAHLRESLCDALPRPLGRAVESISMVRPSPVDWPNREVVDRGAARKRAEYNEFYVSIGRLVALKRVERAIDWAAARGATLVIVGDGPERTALERYARMRHTRVLFVGMCPRVETLEWIAAARGVVVSSDHEGYSTVAREAAELGTNVFEIGRAAALHR